MIGRIGVDLDGVVADFVTGWTSAYETWYGRPVPAVARTTWDGYRELFDSPEAFWRFTDRAGVWSTLPPIQGALGGVTELMDLGFAVTFVTARRDSTRRDTYEWLRRHLPLDTQRTELHFTQAKWVVPCQVYVDDHPSVLDGLARAGKRTVRYAQPWNDGAPATVGVATNWADVVELVKGVFGLGAPAQNEQGATVGDVPLPDVIVDPSGDTARPARASRRQGKGL